MRADPLTTSPHDALTALLDWHLSVGVDIAVDDFPHDRYAECAARARLKVKPSKSPDPPPRASISIATPPTRAKVNAAPTPFPEEAARLAEEAATAAANLDELAARLADFDGCAFKSMATHFLFAAGAPEARLMVLDFAPSEEEERSGAPFSGKAATLLDNMLAAIDLDRNASYLAYFSPWRPPGDKQASPAEQGALLPFARRHVELARPDILLILGEPTARAMLQTSLSGAHLRGRWFDCVCGTRTTRAIVLPSLANVLRTPSLKRNIWRDLRMVAAALR
jgi:uracil-DNA glycosylase family 4